MTAAVAVPLPVPSSVELLESSSEARKRRREILSMQRNIAPEPNLSTEVVCKKRKVSDDDSSTTSSKRKKPQMKYDPDIPMSKEEAAAWRREQRRKRNRESAAASRQRQRDRITELEAEIEEWKVKYEELRLKIQKLEQVTGAAPEDFPEAITRSETPVQGTNTITPRGTPTYSDSEYESEGYSNSESGLEDQELLPIKMISRPA